MNSLRLKNLIHTVKMMKGKQTPTAILFSAAGNDVVQRRLMPLLNPKTAGPNHLNEELVRETVDGAMRCWLELILDQISAECKTETGVPIPIFIHGYDYPVPDGRHILQKAAYDALFKPPKYLYKGVLWLYPSFEEKLYMSQPKVYEEEGVAIMKVLIDRLNAMQKEVAALDRFKRHVFHVDLTKTLSNAPTDYTEYWENELHPTKAGFILLAEKFLNALVKNIPALRKPSQGGGLQ